MESSSLPPDERKRFGITLGEGLFPPARAEKQAGPAKVVAGESVAPVQPDLWSPGKGRSFVPVDEDDERLKAAVLKTWLFPLVALFLGYGIVLGYYAVQFSLRVAILVAPILALALGIQTVVAMAFSWGMLRFSDGTVGNGFLFILRVAGAVSLAAVGLLVPVVGTWVLEPLALWVLLTRFLELSPMEGFVVTLLNVLFRLLLSYYLLGVHLIGAEAARKDCGRR